MAGLPKISPLGSTLVSAGAFTAIDFAMGNRPSFKEWLGHTGIPFAILPLVAPELVWPYIILDTAISLAPLSKELASGITRGYEDARTTTFTGGPMRTVDTRQAATMRQRALSDISASGMTLRNALTGQGRIFHYRYGRY